MEHTPGPWVVEIDHSTRTPEFIRASVESEMFDIASVLCDETGQASANARLIAAAPDLLAALQALLAYEDDMPSKDTYGAQIYAQARSAIAKAAGLHAAFSSN